MLELNCLFRDGMVLEANKPIRVFGKGEGIVEVTFLGKTIKETAKGGEFLLTFPAEKYGGPYEMKVVLDGKETIISDIYVGEVFLMSGQSNMQFTIGDIENTGAKAPSDRIENNLIREFSISRPEQAGGLCTEMGWVKCEGDMVPEFSAISYYLGLEIFNKKKCAVGLVSCCQGASVIEAWMPEEIANLPEFYLPIDKKYLDHIYPDFQYFNQTGLLYHYMFENAVPFSFGAIVWYQGESDTTVEEAAIYPHMLKKMIENWRERLLDRDLQLVIIQIADFKERAEGWHKLQEAQEIASKIIPNASLVVSKDVCEDFEIHPRTKDVLCSRIAEAIINEK